jgi:hypothetical protein
MRRDFLKDLGLSDEIMDKIMTQYGLDIERYKTDKRENEAKITFLNDKIKEQEKAINNMQQENESYTKLKQDYDLLQEEKTKNDNEYKQQIREIKLKSGLEKALNNAGAINQKVVMPLLKEFLDTAEIDEKGNINGLEEQIKQIKDNADTSFLFKETTNTIQGKVPGETLDTPINAKPDFKNMTYEQICEAIKNKT